MHPELLHLSGTGEILIQEGWTVVAIAVPEPDSPISYRFVLAPRSKLLVRSFVRPGTSAEIFAELSGFQSDADLRAVAVSEGGKTARYVSRTESSASKTRACSDVSAFALADGDLFIETVASIAPGVSAGYAEAVQSNVLFGDRAKVRGVPELRIASDDVKARHSCSVERFSEDRLFYLRSRGLTESEATASLLSAKTSLAFSGLPEGFAPLSETLCRSALSAIVGQ